MGENASVGETFLVSKHYSGDISSKSLKEILKRLRTWGDGERMLVQGV